MTASKRTLILRQQLDEEKVPVLPKLIFLTSNCKEILDFFSLTTVLRTHQAQKCS